jgi:formate C-acetyltransferase
MALYPTPFLSITMEGCYRKALDVTGGGTIYNNTGINICGMANAVDALAAIRKLVFEDKKLSLKSYAQARAANYEGWEDLRNEASRHCPKYGNDDDRVDALLADLVAEVARLVKTYQNPRGGKFQLGLYSVEDHAKMGVHTGASPDGRLAGTSLANAISPVQGKDILGPTAVINSLLKTDLSVAANGMVLDLKFNPRFLDKASHVDALKALIESYFQRGGMEIQFNVVDRQTLLDAQAHPEQHKNLVVRVSGFSAYFTTLMKPTQDEIIARTEYAAM